MTGGDRGGRERGGDKRDRGVEVDGRGGEVNGAKWKREVRGIKVRAADLETW